MPCSKKFTEKFGEALQEKLAVALKTGCLHVDKRKELVLRIQELVKTVILPECGGNRGTGQFLFYQKAALEAIDLINK